MHSHKGLRVSWALAWQVPGRRKIHGLWPTPAQQVGRYLLQPVVPGISIWLVGHKVWVWHREGACVDRAGCVTGRAKVAQQWPPDQDDSCQNFGLLIPLNLPTLRHWKGEGIPSSRGLWESEKPCDFTHHKQAPCSLGLSLPCIKQRRDTWLILPV